MPEEKDGAEEPSAVMTVLHDANIPGAVLQLAEKPSTMVSNVWCHSVADPETSEGGGGQEKLNIGRR